MPTYVKVIASKCCGYNVCASICPDVYQLDDHGMAYVDAALVPAGLEDQAVRGARACPEAAIVYSDTPID